MKRAPRNPERLEDRVQPRGQRRIECDALVTTPQTHDDTAADITIKVTR